MVDQDQIISDVKREAESIVRIAEERTKAFVNQDRIVYQAQQKVNELVSQSQTELREMRRTSNDYVGDLMKCTNDALAVNLAELRETCNDTKASQRNNQQ